MEESAHNSKTFAGFPRSYPYPGGDTMAYAPTGFIWDNVLAHKKTLRVYGEFAPGRITWKDPKREGRPEHVAQAVQFLLENDFVTGVCLPVDGGRSIYSPADEAVGTS